MGIDIQRDILGLKGQCVNQIRLDEVKQQLVKLYTAKDGEDPWARARRYG